MKTSIAAEEIMQLHVQIAPPLDIGRNDDGHLRVIPITGGYFQGELFNGKIIPGGADWNTEITQNYNHVHAVYCIQEDDGTILSIDNEGWIDFSSDSIIRTVPRITTVGGKGKYDVFKTGVFVGALDASGADEGIIGITIFKLA